MTIQQANEYFAALSDGFAEAEAVRKAAGEAQAAVNYVGIAGTAGKTAVASMLAAVLQAAGFCTGLYTAGLAPLRARLSVDGRPVEAGVYTAAAAELKRQPPLPRPAAELVAACRCFAALGCTFAVVELPDSALAQALPTMPACAVTRIGPDGSGHSLERLAYTAAGVMRQEALCVTAPEQPKAALTEIIVAAGKCGCELVVPDAEDISFPKARKFTNLVNYGGYEAALPFIGRHAAGNAAVAVELALGLWRKGFDISDEAILDGLAAAKNTSSICILRRRPLMILDACHTPQQAQALTRVLRMAQLPHLSAVIGLTEEAGAEAFFAALETGFLPEEKDTEKNRMPGMADNPFDKVYLIAPEGCPEARAQRIAEKARFHFDVEVCAGLAQALEQASGDENDGILICGGETVAEQAARYLKENR